MKLFISWSGERSQAMATALHEWFPLTLHYIKPWMSKSDIQAGDRWTIEIAKELETTNFGIICITKDNLNAPWLLFEAGALAKSMQHGRVIPLLLDLDVKDVSGPLAQFQAIKADAPGTKRLLTDLNKAAPEPIAEQTVEKLFEALWSSVDEKLAKIPKATKDSKGTRSQNDILEELVSGVRSVEMRIRDLSDEEKFSKGFPKRKMGGSRNSLSHLAEVSNLINPYGAQTLKILILASQIKDEAPWLFELAMDVHRTSISEHPKMSYRPRKIFRDMIEALDQSFFAKEAGIDPYILHSLRREIITLEQARKVTRFAPKPTPEIRAVDATDDAAPDNQEQADLPTKTDEN